MQARDKVANGFEDKTISWAEAKLNSAERSLKSWGRKAVARASAAIREGASTPDEMARPPAARAVPAAIA